METITGYDEWKQRQPVNPREEAIRERVDAYSEHELLEEALRSGIDLDAILEEIREYVVDRKLWEDDLES